METHLDRIRLSVRRTRLHWGQWIAARPAFPPLPEITQHQIFLRGMPRSFDGLRVVQLSDLHHGLYVSRQEIEQAVELANRLHPDLVFLTGDFVTQSWVHVEPVAEALGQLTASLGVFAVMGNHDHRTGADRLEQYLTRQGIQVLRNRHALLRRGGDALGLVGVDDLHYTCDLARALRRFPDGVPRILLCHNPAIIAHAARERIEFVVSGHTHGGQIRLPGLRRGYRCGLHRLRGTQIYISRGIGKVVVPIRLGSPPEIPLFHLKSTTGDLFEPHASC